MKTGVQIQQAIYEYLKTKTSVTSLLSSSAEIKESQWQGTIFDYPAVRISVDVFPNVADNCPDRIECTIDTFSDEKSSLVAQQISGAIALVLHKIPFSQNSLNFSSVVVTKISRAVQTPESAWRSGVDFYAFVS